MHIISLSSSKSDRLHLNSERIFPVIMYTLPLTMFDGHMVLISVELLLNAADTIPFGVFPTVKTELRVSLNIAVCGAL